MNKPTPHYAITTLEIAIGNTKALGVEKAKKYGPSPSEAMAIFRMAIRREREALNEKLQRLVTIEQRGEAYFKAYRSHMLTVNKRNRFGA